MKTQPYDAILFDFDGVLIDSEPLHWHCWAQVLEPLGIQLDWNTYRDRCIGVSDRDLLEFFGRCAQPPRALDSLWEYYVAKQKMFQRLIAQRSPFLPEILELMRSLKDYKLGVVTSSARAEVEPVLRRAGLLPLISTAVYGDEVRHHKPSPEPYLLAAARIGAKHPLVIEDSEAGMASAGAAGFDAVRVRSPHELVDAVRRALHLSDQAP